MDEQRENFILWQALHYAIAAIDSLPEHERELSNQEDMRLILQNRFPNSATEPTAIRLVQGIRARFGLPPVSEVL